VPQFLQNIREQQAKYKRMNLKVRRSKWTAAAAHVHFAASYRSPAADRHGMTRNAVAR
jgi:hypothetical protein